MKSFVISSKPEPSGRTAGACSGSRSRKAARKFWRRKSGKAPLRTEVGFPGNVWCDELLCSWVDVKNDRDSNMGETQELGVSDDDRSKGGQLRCFAAHVSRER